MPETIVTRKKEIIEFIDKIIDEIYELLEAPKGIILNIIEKNWMSEDKAREFSKRIDKIGDNLKKREATKAK